MTHFEKEEQNELKQDHEEISKETKSEEPKPEESKHEESKHEVHKHKSEKHHATSHEKAVTFNLWKIATVVLAVILIITVGLNFTGSNELSEEEAGVKIVMFVNQNLLQGQAVAKLESVTEEGNLYNVKLTISGQEVDSYVTKDGEIFFPQGMKTSEAEVAAAASASATPEPAANVPKSDKPVVELFVMSHCPFGTQAEKGILPVVNLLGDKIDFQLKFVYYAMHGKTELDEQMKQVCINDEQSTKFNEYLACFLEDGDSERCLDSVGINKAKGTSCVSKLDKEFSILENYADKSTWLSGNYPLFDVHKADNEKYGVGGSPTLVINGQQADSARSPASYLATICTSFNEMPKECTESTGVSTETFQPGFGYELGAATQASCG